MKIYDVVISGMGPGGLATAIWSLKQGKSVLIVSDRPPEFIRVQHVYLDETFRGKLDDFLSDKDTSNEEDIKFQTLLHTHLTIAIKDIERYLLRRVMELDNGNNLQIMSETRIQSIDMDKGIVGIEGEESACFTWLIGADGKNHHALNVLTTDEPSIKDKVEIGNITAHMHKYHVSTYLNVSRSDGKKINLPKRNLIASFQHGLLCGVVFKKEEYDSQSDKPLKVCVTCELPEALYIENDKKKILDYVSAALNHVFTKEKLHNGQLIMELTKNSKKYGEAKDHLKLLPFQTTPTEKHLTACQRNKKYFLQVGDALMNLHYRTGGGLMFALYTAEKIADIMTGKLSIKEYEDDCSDFLSCFKAGKITQFLFNNSLGKQYFNHAYKKRVEHRANETQKWLEKRTPR